MDLYVYMQIPDIGVIVEKNGINVPRLRGYRLMGLEEPVSNNHIAITILDQERYLYRRMCTSIPRFHPNSNMSEFSSATDRLKKKYCIFEGEEIVSFRWDLVHGKNRKRLKFAIKNARKAVLKSLLTFNKYVGRKDVLCIRARIGGENWSYFGGEEIARKPWFIEKVDDYFDDTYCDIYAKIDPSSLD